MTSAAEHVGGGSVRASGLSAGDGGPRGGPSAGDSGPRGGPSVGSGALEDGLRQLHSEHSDPWCCHASFARLDVRSTISCHYGDSGSLGEFEPNSFSRWPFSWVAGCFGSYVLRASGWRNSSASAIRGLRGELPSSAYPAPPLRLGGPLRTAPARPVLVDFVAFFKWR